MSVGIFGGSSSRAMCIDDYLVLILGSERRCRFERRGGGLTALALATGVVVGSARERGSGRLRRLPTELLDKAWCIEASDGSIKRLWSFRLLGAELECSTIAKLQNVRQKCSFGTKRVGSLSCKLTVLYFQLFIFRPYEFMVLFKFLYLSCGHGAAFGNIFCHFMEFGFQVVSLGP